MSKSKSHSTVGDGGGGGGERLNSREGIAPSTQTDGIIKPKFKLKHQNLSVNVDFSQKALWGQTELMCGVTDRSIDIIRINSRQCRLHRVQVNGIDAEYNYDNDPLMEIVSAACTNPTAGHADSDQQSPTRAYRHFAKEFKTAQINPDLGELMVFVPRSVMPPEEEGVPDEIDVDKNKDKDKEGAEKKVKELFQLTITIKFSLVNPRGGVYFVMPTSELVNDRPPHMFTHNQTNGARLWFPCLDTWTDRATWTLTYTVPPKMTAVSCGYLYAQELVKDKSKKRCEYRVPVPTPACDIGFVVGEFDLLQDKTFPAMTSFCLPGLLPQLTNTVSIMARAFDFFTDYLGVKFPFRSYKQVFVDDTYQDMSSFSSLSVFNDSVLHSKSIIEPTHSVRWKLVYSAARQYFGHYLTQKAWADTWLLIGMAGYVANLFMIRAHGVKENLLQVGELMESVCAEEAKGQAPLYNTDFAHPSELYSEFVRKKSLAVMWMIERRIGDEHFQRVLNNMLGMASQYKRNGDLSVLGISTHSFLKLVKKASGQDLKGFADVWIRRNGCVQFTVNFSFNRKRSSIELSLRQDPIGLPAGTKFSGPVRIRVQEMDGYTIHDMHLDDSYHKQDFNCRSKFRRARKRKVRLPTGEETDIEFLDQADTPILFIRFDPEFFWLRRVVYEHLDLPADYMWIYQMQYDRDPYAQREAIKELARFPSSYAHDALLEVVRSPDHFYQTRISAAQGLAKHPQVNVEENGLSHLLHNAIPGTKVWGWETLINACKQMYFNTYQNGQQYVRQNNFSGLREYFVQKSIPLALSAARNKRGAVPKEVVEFILHMIDFNDNTHNLFSDSFYIMGLLEALARALTTKKERSEFVVVNSKAQMDTLNRPLLRRVVETIVRLTNMDMLIPTYANAITQGCLKVLTQLCLSDRFHVDELLPLLTQLAQYGHFRGLRVTSIQCMVELSVKMRMQVLPFIVTCAESDPDYGIRQIAMKTLQNSPIFIEWARGTSSYALVEKVWHMMNRQTCYDIYLRMRFMQLYKRLWGTGTPRSTKAKRKHDRKVQKRLGTTNGNVTGNIIRVRSTSATVQTGSELSIGVDGISNVNNIISNENVDANAMADETVSGSTVIGEVSNGKIRPDVSTEISTTPSNTIKFRKLSITAPTRCTNTNVHTHVQAGSDANKHVERSSTNIDYSDTNTHKDTNVLGDIDTSSNANGNIHLPLLSHTGNKLDNEPGRQEETISKLRIDNTLPLSPSLMVSGLDADTNTINNNVDIVQGDDERVREETSVQRKSVDTDEIRMMRRRSSDLGSTSGMSMGSSDDGSGTPQTQTRVLKIKLSNPALSEDGFHHSDRKKHKKHKKEKRRRDSEEHEL
eukprot:CFRG7396T1